MASFKAKIHIPADMFPEIGQPMSPRGVKDAKPSKELKDDYVSYCQETVAASENLKNLACTYGEVFSSDSGAVDFNFDYEKETSKTYKFLGMDIDEDYNAVIKIGSGHIVVGSMFDRDSIKKILNWDLRWSDSDTKDLCLDMVDKLNENDVRLLSTGIKTGQAYTIASSRNDSYVDPDSWSKLIHIVINSTMGSSGGGISHTFKSIILNLVHEKDLEQTAVKVSSSDNSYASLILSAIMKSWYELAGKYSEMLSASACIDIWSNINRRMTGADVFNARMESCVTLTDESTGEVLKGGVSFSGASKNTSATDAGIIIDYSRNAMFQLANAVQDNRASDDVDVTDLMLGFADVSGIDDIYSVSKAELQAMSVLDSLQYIDEDAELCKETYDMNDPDERGLFVKSSIRSYERNFKEFKPAENYDVTEALADIVDRGDVNAAPNLIPDMNTSTPDDELGATDVITTKKSEEIKADKIIEDLKKVLKLVNKNTTKILAGF